MTWEGVFWPDAGAQDTVTNLGRHSFSTRPEPGQLVEINGHEHRVVFAGEGFCYVRPAIGERESR